MTAATVHGALAMAAGEPAAELAGDEVGLQAVVVLSPTIAMAAMTPITLAAGC